MEGTGCTRHPNSHNKRVSHTFYRKTATGPTENLKQPQNEGKRGDVRYNLPNDIPRCIGTGCQPTSELCLDDVFSSQRRRNLSPYIQPKEIKPICSDPAIQTYKHFSCARLPPTRRLDVQGGLITSLFQSGNIPNAQTVPTIDLPRKTTTNDLLAFRSEYCAKGFCNINQLGCTNPKRRGHTCSCLFGRFSRRPSRLRDIEKTYKNCPKPHALFGVEDKWQEINSTPLQTPCIPRSSLGPLAKREIGAPRENFRPKNKANQCPRETHDYNQSLAEPNRPFEFCKFCSTVRQTTFQGHTDVPKPNQKRISCQCARLTKQCTGRNKMVDSQSRSEISDTPPTSVSFCDHRCVRHCLGSPDRQSHDLRSMVRSRKISSLQPKGDARYTKSLTATRDISTKVDDTGPVRQQDRCSIPKKRRRHQVTRPIELDKTNLLLPRVIPDSAESTTYSWQIQQSRRPRIASSAPTRVASSPRLYGENIRKIWATNDRPLCLRASESGLELCDVRPERSSCDLSRCFLPRLELPAGLALSTAVPNSKGPTAPQLSERSVHSHSPEMGTSLLEAGPKESCDCPTVHNPRAQQTPDRHDDGFATSQSPRNDVRSLEMWGWSPNLTDWNEDQVKLLRTSWRTSTLKTYRVAWKRWLKWAHKHKNDPLRPTGSILARFLADLHLVEGLSYNTILLHKSVVSTLCNPDIANSLSSHILVSHVLKSIAIKKPASREKVIWNVDKLSSFLTTYSVDQNSLFSTCRHTATLLLLCSGRRVHDLTLLAVDSKHFSIDSNCVIMWPMFGSKTDTASYRQSGWRLSPNPSNINLDPAYWVRQTISLTRARRQLANCPNLFLNLRGPPRAASRTIIAGWIKSLLLEAGIATSPGSLRSAVASKHWSNNCPVDEILSKGNWRSQDTFSRFYCKEVLPVSTSQYDTSQLFNTV